MEGATYQGIKDNSWFSGLLNRMDGAIFLKQGTLNEGQVLRFFGGEKGLKVQFRFIQFEVPLR